MATTAPTPEQETPAPEPAPNRFFEWMRSLDVPRQPGWVGGVCAGIAARLGIDPLIVRGIFVVVAIFGGPALLLYAAAWLLLPDAGNKIHLEEAVHGRFESPLAGIAALVVVALLPVGHGFWIPTYDWSGWSGAVGGAIWTLVLLGAVVWFIIWIARRSQSTVTPPPAGFAGTPPAPAPEKPAPDAPAEEVAAWRFHQAKFKAEHTQYRNEQQVAAAIEARARSREAAAAARAEYNAKRALTKPSTLFTLVVVGLSIIAGGLTVLTVGGQTPTLDDVAPALAVALAVLATGIIINGVRGKRSGGASPLAVLVVITLIFGWSVAQIPRFAASRDLVIAPTSDTLPGSPWFIGEGDVRADLTNVFDEPAADDDFSQPEFETYVGWGDVTITIPGDEYVTVSVETSGNSTVSMAPGGDRSDTDSYRGRFDRHGVFQNYSIPGDTEGAHRSLYVHVWVGEGDVTIRRAPVEASITEEEK